MNLLAQFNPLASSDQPTPDYQILVNGKDISPKMKTRLMSLRLTDNRGFEADTVEVQLDDADGELAMPPKGATMQVRIGWKGSALVDKGTYTIDELEHSGPPDAITIRGKSADMRGTLQQSREQSFHKQSVSSIIDVIAARHQLKAKISDNLKMEFIDHIDQANESDANFLSRLAEQFDAIATVKNGNLLFLQAGLAHNASGIALDRVDITRQSGDSHHFGVADRDAYSGVVAYWQNDKAAKRQTVKAKKPTEAKPSDVKVIVGEKEIMVGSNDNVKTLRHTYANKQNAERAARAMWDKLQRGVATFTITLAMGRPELFPELPVNVSGFKPQIDNSDWLLTRVEHNITDTGYTTGIELEVKNSEVAEVAGGEDGED
ncbi:phage late control D family protein [Shewanella sp. SW32]|uniref:phage late control D family protein n=1 Tax=unclassified Shewanella TaxID=196818 RepID=UPI0021D8BF10|nr:MULTISPECIES: phage late control D family protein [unclassified Shewanella]MCU7964033.1 phage late control D family protein [Shewanella sp. SW32]MCU7971938.1 phage late control D family protein [Shewanella sp. SW29]MCU8062884.1 phage late control D family protein [Shewanella sp. SM55]